MSAAILHIARNTFREAVRDRVLYNLVAFALLMSGAAILVGQISIAIERLVVINLGLSAISIFGIVIAIFIGIGLVSKEIEKKTLYTVLSRPVRRWEFIIGKYFGLAGTLVVNTFLMSVGFYTALLLLTRHLGRSEANILVAIYFIVLQSLIITAISLLFSSFSTPIESAVYALAMFIVGSFAEDLRGFAAIAHGPQGWFARVASYIVPNLSVLNVITRVSHDQIIPPNVIALNTIYALLYVTVVV